MTYTSNDKPVFETPTSPRFWKPEGGSGLFEYDLKAFNAEGGVLKACLTKGDEFAYINVYPTAEYKAQRGDSHITMMQNRGNDKKIITEELAPIGLVTAITHGSFPRLKPSNISSCGMHEITWDMFYLDQRQVWVPTYPRAIKYGSKLLNEPMSGRSLWDILRADRSDGSTGKPTQEDTNMITTPYAVVSVHSFVDGEALYVGDDSLVPELTLLPRDAANKFLSDVVLGSCALVNGKYPQGGFIKAYEAIETGGTYPGVKVMLVTEHDNVNQWTDLEVLPNGHPKAKRAFVMYSGDSNETTFVAKEPKETQPGLNLPAVTSNLHEAVIFTITTDNQKAILGDMVEAEQNGITAVDMVSIP